jgi:hypothetical protein
MIEIRLPYGGKVAHKLENTVRSFPQYFEARYTTMYTNYVQICDLDDMTIEYWALYIIQKSR